MKRALGYVTRQPGDVTCATPSILDTLALEPFFSLGSFKSAEPASHQSKHSEVSKLSFVNIFFFNYCFVFTVS